MTSYQKRNKSAESRVIAELRRNGWTTVWFITQSRDIASAVDRLERDGVIERTRLKVGKPKGVFPHMHYKIHEERICNNNQKENIF